MWGYPGHITDIQDLQQQCKNVFKLYTCSLVRFNASAPFYSCAWLCLSLICSFPMKMIHSYVLHQQSPRETTTVCADLLSVCFYLVLLVLMNHVLASIYALFSDCGNVVLLPNSLFFHFHLLLNGVLWLKIQRKLCKLSVNRGCIMLLTSFSHVPGCVFFINQRPSDVSRSHCPHF